MKKLTLVSVLLVGMALGVLLDRAIAPSPSAAPTQAPLAAAPAVPAPPAKVEDPKTVYRVPLEDSPVRGPADALVTIVESSDFECPFCKRAAPTMKQIEEAYRGKVRFAFKHNPLTMHRGALPAAILAEEARAQGRDAKFWAAHDKLFTLPSLDRASLEKAARELGLRASGVQAALDQSKHLDRIRRDQTLVNSLGARGTPAFFVNGRKVIGARPFEAFKAVIDQEIEKAEGLVRSGVKKRDLYAKLIEGGATAPVMVAAPASAAAARTDVVLPIRADDPARGEASAKVTIIEFSDFQCPFCSRAEPAVKAVEQTFGKDVRIVWKHLPLAMHANAMPAALAAEAAREQGKFWEMHDRLYANQQALSDAAYGQYAKELRLDLERFQAALKAPETRRRVEADLAAASAAGVTGTPTFVVNGEVVPGSGGLQDAVIRQLAKARLAKR